MPKQSDEAYKLTKLAVSALKKATRIVPCSDVSSFVLGLENIVEDINQIKISEVQRFDLICRFLETDQVTFKRVDDSSGHDVGGVYSNSAQAVFKESAVHLAETDQQLIADELDSLLSADYHRLHDSLLGDVIVFLDDSINRGLINRFTVQYDQHPFNFRSCFLLSHIRMIACHLGDTELFKTTALKSATGYDEVPSYIKYEIASNYFKNDEFEQAKIWVDKIDVNEEFQRSDRNRLLVALHDQLGNYEERDRIARDEFNSAPSLVALDGLLETIGEKYRSEIVEVEIERIFSSCRFSGFSLEFLIDTERMELASDYVLRYREAINTDQQYFYLAMQASSLLESGYPLAAICIYRALLDSVLQQEEKSTNSYGVRYLKILDKLSDTAVIKGMIDHATYKQGIKTTHGTNDSFWLKYDSAL